MNFYPNWLHKAGTQFRHSPPSVSPPQAASPQRPLPREFSIELPLYPDSHVCSVPSAPARDAAWAYALVFAIIENTIAEISAEFDDARRERAVLAEESPE